MPVITPQTHNRGFEELIRVCYGRRFQTDVRDQSLCNMLSVVTGKGYEEGMAIGPLGRFGRWLDATTVSGRTRHPGGVPGHSADQAPEAFRHCETALDPQPRRDAHAKL